VEQDAHIEGALAAEASLVVLDTLESVVQADGGGGIYRVFILLLKYDKMDKLHIRNYYRCGCWCSIESVTKGSS